MSEDDYQVTPERFEKWVKPLLKVQYPRAKALYDRIYQGYGLKWCYHLANVLIRASQANPRVVRETLQTIEDEMEIEDIFPHETFRWLEYIGFEEEDEDI